MNPDARLIGILKMKAFRRSRHADGRNAAGVDMVSGVNGNVRCVVPVRLDGEVDADIRPLLVRRRDEARQPLVGRDDQAGRAMLDRRAQVLLLFGPPSMIAPLIVALPVLPETPPKISRIGVT